MNDGPFHAGPPHCAITRRSSRSRPFDVSLQKRCEAAAGAPFKLRCAMCDRVRNGVERFDHVDHSNSFVPHTAIDVIR